MHGKKEKEGLCTMSKMSMKKPILLAVFGANGTDLINTPNTII